MKDIEAQVMELLTPREVVPLLRDMIRIPSVGSSDGEGALAAFINGFLDDHGIETATEEVLPGRPNVIGRLGPAGGPSLLFNAHMDIVPPGKGWSYDPYEGLIAEDKIYGRGAVDDKGPLAAMLSAVVALKDSSVPLRGQLVMCAVVDEENASRGSRLLMQSLQGDIGVVGEPTGGDLVIAHNGSLRPMLKAVGRTAHTSRPGEGVNAIYKMAQVLITIRAYHDELSARTHPLTGSASITVSMIHGGEQPNVIPDRCEALLDRRLVPGEREEEALREINDLLDQAMTRDPDMKIVIDHLIPTTGGPCEIPPDSSIVKLLCEAVFTASGRRPHLKGLSGACDMVHLINAGIPTAVFGPGNPSQAHKPDEHIRIDELITGARSYALFALRYLT